MRLHVTSVSSGSKRCRGMKRMDPTSLSPDRINRPQCMKWRNSSSQISLSPLHEVLGSEGLPLSHFFSCAQPQTAVESLHNWRVLSSQDLLVSSSSSSVADDRSPRYQSSCSDAITERSIEDEHQITDHDEHVMYTPSETRMMDVRGHTVATGDRVRPGTGPDCYNSSFMEQSLHFYMMADVENTDTNLEMDSQEPQSLKLTLGDLAPRFGPNFLLRSSSSAEEDQVHDQKFSSKNAHKSYHDNSVPSVSTSRAKRGCATNPRSIAERMRRIRISERLRKLQDLLPARPQVEVHFRDTAEMLDEVVQYVKYLQQQIIQLSESKCAGHCQVRNNHRSGKGGRTTIAKRY